MVANTNINAIKQIIEASIAGEMDYQSAELMLQNILNSIDIIPRHRGILVTQDEDTQFFKQLINAFKAIENPHLIDENYFNRKQCEKSSLFCDADVAKSKVLFAQVAIGLYEKFEIVDYPSFIKQTYDNEGDIIQNLPEFKDMKAYIDRGMEHDYDDYVDECDDDDDEADDFDSWYEDNIEDFLNSVCARNEFMFLVVKYLTAVYEVLNKAA